MASDVVQRLNGSIDRLNSALAEKAEQERREIESDARSQAMIDAQTNRDRQAAYDPIFERYEEQTPQPVADENVASYQRRLMRVVQNKLSPTDERRLPGSPTTTIGDIAKVPVGELARTARQAFEPLFHSAAEIQARQPHTSTLPSDGSLVARVEVDDTGQKTRRWFGVRSFIADLSTPGRKVERIVDRTTGNAIWGKPFSKG